MLKNKKKFAPENMKNPPSKVAHNRPRPFFSVLPIGPNPAQISIPVPQKSPTARLLYNDFAYTTRERTLCIAAIDEHPPLE